MVGKVLRVLALIVLFPLAFGLGLCGLCGSLFSVVMVFGSPAAGLLGLVPALGALGIAYGLFLLVQKIREDLARNDD